MDGGGEDVLGVLFGGAAPEQVGGQGPQPEKKKRGKKNKAKGGSDQRAVVVEGNRKRRRTAPSREHEDDADGDDEIAHEEEEEEESEVGFEELGLHKWVVKQCRTMGLARPTPVQRHCIPAILAGRDCCASAKTGSGKTLAFALPMLHMLSKDPYGIFGVVLTPTRELALQIADQFRAFGTGIGLRDAVIIGGMDMVAQSVQLAQRPHIVIATPGRLADHLQSSELSLKRVKFLVLDEADRLMTNSTLQPDLDVILDAIPAKSRATLLFSATMPDELTGRVAESLKQPLFTYEAKSDTKTVKTLSQSYLFIPSHVRHCYLVNVLRVLPEDASCIVFTSTCRSCAELGIMLREVGFRCVTLHSQMTQAERISSLDKFKSNYIKLLIATDVASRGLDIPTVETVVNFNVPKAVEDYIHRVGRTARIGKGGKAVTLVSERDVSLVQAIEKTVGVTMDEFESVKEKDVLQSLNEVNIARRAANLQLLESNFGERRKIHKEKQAAVHQAADNAGSADQATKKKKKKKKQKGAKAD